MTNSNRNQKNNDFNDNRGHHQRGAYKQGNDYNSERENFGGTDRGNTDWNQDNNLGYGSNARSSYNRQNFGEAGFDRDFQNDYNTRVGNWGVGNHGENRGNDDINRWNERNRGRYDDESGFGTLGSGGNQNQRNSWNNNSDNWGNNSNWQNSNRSGMDYGSGSYGSSNWRNNDNRNWRNNNDSDNWQRSRTSYDSRNRDWWDRTSDEVSSWFGDEEAERRRRMDKMNESNHKGKGPKGYKRSDDRIKEDINDRLSDDPYVDASEIDIEMENGEVILSGTVSSKQEKRRVEDLVEAVSGVSHVENRLRVKSNTYANASNSGLNTRYDSGSEIR